MAKHSQMILTICLLVVLTISGIQVDNYADTFTCSTELSGSDDASVMVETGNYGINRGYSCIEQQDYWTVNGSTRVSSLLYKRSQNGVRSHARNNVIVAAFDTCRKAVMFSIVMILFATGSAGLSMPFRCLLYYIHNMDGKKRIA